MFDVDLAGGESYRESNNYRAGELAVIADLPWGRLGLTVCYDLRFPALYRALAEAGASFLAIPSSFTRQTGEAHWHVLHARPRHRKRLLRLCRGAGRQARERPRDLRPFARRRSVGPHLAEGGIEPAVLIAEIDPAEVAAARSRIPSLRHGRRFELVEPMAEPTYLHAVKEPI